MRLYKNIYICFSLRPAFWKDKYLTSLATSGHLSWQILYISLLLYLDYLEPSSVGRVI